MDEYFSTEVKPFFFDDAVRDRALRFTRVKQSLVENYNSFLYAFLDGSRDWINMRSCGISYPGKIFAQTRATFDATSIFRLSDRANRVFSWNTCSHSSRCDALPGKGLSWGPTITEQSSAWYRFSLCVFFRKAYFALPYHRSARSRKTNTFWSSHKPSGWLCISIFHRDIFATFVFQLLLS